MGTHEFKRNMAVANTGGQTDAVTLHRLLKGACNQMPCFPNVLEIFLIFNLEFSVCQTFLRIFEMIKRMQRRVKLRRRLAEGIDEFNA